MSYIIRTIIVSRWVRYGIGAFFQLSREEERTHLNEALQYFYDAEADVLYVSKGELRVDMDRLFLSESEP